MREKERERERQIERQTDRQRGEMTKIVDVTEKEKEVSDIKYQPNQVNHKKVRREERKKEIDRGEKARATHLS